MKKDITIIIGPTAIGKTDYSLNLAQKTNAEIISSDAFQVYRGLDIGTAKPSKEIMSKIPHHLIDIKNPEEPYSVVDFLAVTHKIIQEIREKQIPIIITGGTAFYLYSFLYNYEFANTKPDLTLRENLYSEIKEIGNELMWQKLNNIDPGIKTYIHVNDTKRIVRAFEIYYQTNELPSRARKKSCLRADVTLIGLTASREIIYDRINKRVDEMYQNGFIDEVNGLLQKGYSEDLPSFKALGYTITANFLNGSITKEEMIELVKKETRNFAKRQITWYKQFKDVRWIEITPK
ncbi:MAG: tRNA (adenosine(37)-N6)-dimethylallyltransferase MiaA [Candidatus Margulisiibacteriota bacterium]|jgi:tRNA dimethylallyltransferase